MAARPVNLPPNPLNAIEIDDTASDISTATARNESDSAKEVELFISFPNINE